MKKVKVTLGKTTGGGVKKQELLKMLRVIGRHVAAASTIPHIQELLGAADGLIGAFESGDQPHILRAKQNARRIMYDH